MTWSEWTVRQIVGQLGALVKESVDETYLAEVFAESEELKPVESEFYCAEMEDGSVENGHLGSLVVSWWLVGANMAHRSQPPPPREFQESANYSVFIEAGVVLVSENYVVKEDCAVHYPDYRWCRRSAAVEQFMSITSLKEVEIVSKADYRGQRGSVDRRGWFQSDGLLPSFGETLLGGESRDAVI